MRYRKYELIQLIIEGNFKLCYNSLLDNLVNILVIFVAALATKEVNAFFGKVQLYAFFLKDKHHTIIFIGLDPFVSL